MTSYKKQMLKARAKRAEQQQIDRQVKHLRHRFGLARKLPKGFKVLTRDEALSALDREARKGAEEHVQQLLEAEVDRHLDRQRYQHLSPEAHRGYRNGHAPARTIATRGGPVKVNLPKLRDLKQPFVSQLVPKRQQQTSGINSFLPNLYLAGLSLGDFTLFLRELLGDDANLSASHIVRLKRQWEKEYRLWVKRPLRPAYAYVWADGVYLRVGRATDRLAVLVVMGVNEDGRKELLAIEPGYRESSANWGSVFGSLRERGLAEIQLVIGDGCPGLWHAVGQHYWTARQQLCWQHKLASVLGKLPDRLQKEATADLRAIYHAGSRAAATAGFIRFATKYRDHEPAVECLLKDQDRLTTYYDFPKPHWVSLRTSNPLESIFDPVRVRLNKAKRIVSLYAALALVHQLLLLREIRLNRIIAYRLVASVLNGDQYQDGKALDRRLKQNRRKSA